MSGTRSLLVILASLLGFAPELCHAQWSVIEGQPKPSKVSFLVEQFSRKEWEASNFAPAQDVARFQDWRFGLMISFGLTVHGKAELSWGTITANERKAPDGNALSDGISHPMAEWVRWDRQLRLERFDAREWVRFAKAAGFRYLVIIAKHHEGFHQWDTAFSDYKVTNTPFGRDYLKEVIDACHEQGMPVGIYYSQRDWYHPDYSPVGWGKDGAEPGPTHQKYKDYQFKVVRELLTKYGKIDIFWWDALWWGGMFHARDWDAERLTRMVRELQPHIVMNNRASVPGDFDTPEQRSGVFQTWRPWEAAVSFEETWSYTGNKPKSAEQIIRLLVRSAVDNGNLLLSLGPRWEGDFDSGEVATMMRVGDWLRTHGQAIYGTRGGPWKPAGWGGTTWRGSTAYLHLLDPPRGEISLRSVPGNPVRRVSVLSIAGGGKSTLVAAKFRESGGFITIPVSTLADAPVDTILVADMTHALDGAQPLEAVSQDGATVSDAHLKPFDYELVYGRQVPSVLGLSASGLTAPLGPDTLQKLVGADPSEGIAVQTTSGPGSWILIDLGKVMLVTGVYLDASAGELPIELAVSVDGAGFHPVWTSVPQGDRAPWEIEVNDFKAGAQTPGREARYLRLQLPATAHGALTVRHIAVWSKADK